MLIYEHGNDQEKHHFSNRHINPNFDDFIRGGKYLLARTFHKTTF